MSSRARTSTTASERTPLLEVPPEPIAGDEAAGLDTEHVVTESPEDEPEYELSRTRIAFLGSTYFSLLFLQAANISALITTQGLVAEELGAYSNVSWFTSAYLIAMSSVTPLGGRMSKIFSARAYVLFGCVLFVVGGVVTGFAESVPVFLFGRVLTGLAGACILSTAMILILELVSVKRRGLAFGLMNASFTAGASCGAVFSGAIATSYGWRWTFWGQAPLAALAGVGVFFALPSTLEREAKQTWREQLSRVDFLGLVLLVTTVVLFLYALSARVIQVIPLAISPVTLILFILVEKYLAAEPIIPIAVFRSLPLAFTCFSTLSNMIARWAVLFYSPIYMTAAHLWSPAASGAILVPTNTGFAVGTILVGWLHIREGGSYYFSSLLSHLFGAAIVFWLSTLAVPSTPVPLFATALAFGGIFTGTMMNYSLVHLLYRSEPEHHPIVTPLVATFRGFAGSFGSAIGGGIFTRSLYNALVKGLDEPEKKEELIQRLLGNPGIIRSLNPRDQQVAMESYSTAIQMLFLAGTGFALLGAVLQAGTGWRSIKAEEEQRRDD